MKKVNIIFPALAIILATTTGVLATEILTKTAYAENSSGECEAVQIADECEIIPTGALCTVILDGQVKLTYENPSSCHAGGHSVAYKHP